MSAIVVPMGMAEMKIVEEALASGKYDSKASFARRAMLTQARLDFIEETLMAQAEHDEGKSRKVKGSISTFIKSL